MSTSPTGSILSWRHAMPQIEEEAKISILTVEALSRHLCSGTGGSSESLRLHRRDI